MPVEESPNDTEALTLTWSFKKKSNVTRRGRLNAHEFKYKEVVRYKEDGIASTGTNEVTIRIVLVVMIVLKLYGGY